jgi:hypothetical protein
LCSFLIFLIIGTAYCFSISAIRPLVLGSGIVRMERGSIEILVQGLLIDFPSWI